MLSRIWKQRDKNPLSIIVLPYVSLINEKEMRLQKLVKGMQFGHRSINLQSMYAHKRAIVKEDTNIVLCTIEKANQLMSTLIEEHRTCNEHSRLLDIQSIIIDELHMIGDEQRGFLFEILLTKLVFINKGIVISNENKKKN